MRLLALVPFAILCSSATARAERGPKPDSLSIVVVGDVGLNRNNLKVHEDGALEGSSVLSWKKMGAKVAPLIDGDLNFMNLETVVTDRNDLKPGDKRQKSPYLFRSHPAGVEHLLDLGFNLISAANNHAYDYGEEGAKETIRHLQRLTEERQGAVYSGIGLNADEAARPATRWVRGAQVAFSSIGIVTNMLSFHRAGANKAGTLGFRHAKDWKRSVEALSAAPADLKLLSVHYGLERDIRTDARQKTAWREAVAKGAADVVIGHHAHVVRGVELHKGKLIFYGLGNFMIRGAANMGKKRELRTCCDYGLLARVHMLRNGDGYEVAAVEAVPVFDMHRIPRPLAAAESGRRIEVLNVLAEGLDDAKQDSVGVRFAIRKDGTGLFCSQAGRARARSAAPGPIGAMCKGYQGAAPVSKEVRQRVRAAPDPRKAKKRRARRRKNKKRRRNRRRR